MSQEYIYEGQKPFPEGSTKRKPLEQVNSLDQQNYEANYDKTIMRSAEQTDPIMSEMNYLNSQLQYKGFPLLNHYQGCSIQHLNELCHLLRQLIQSRAAEKDKIKQLQTQNNKLRFECSNLKKKLDDLEDQNRKFQREKEEIYENMKLQQRDYKAKEEKYIKERDILMKEKRAMEARQNAIKSDFKKKDQKIQTLENKCRKLMEKNQKSDYKNSLQILQLLPKKSQNLSTVEQECEAVLIRTIQQKEQMLLKENNILKQYLKEVIDRLLAITEKNLESPEKKKEYTRFINLLQNCSTHSEGFIEILRNLLGRVDRMMSDTSNMTDLLSDVKGKDNSALIGSLEKMKFYFNQAVDLDKKRSKFTNDIFTILGKKEKLNITLLERMTNNMNGVSGGQFSLHSEQYQKILRTQAYFEQSNLQLDKTASFLRQKIQLMSQQSQFIDFMQRDMQKFITIGQEGDKLL